MSELRISKLDAARRQLETAVRLYFSEADPVSIHTLTSAAHAVLTDISSARGAPPMIEDAVLLWVDPEHRKKIRQRLRAAANFFKHAQRDAEAVHVLKMSQTEIRLFDACERYRVLTDELVPLLGVYRLWFFLGPGAAFVDPSREKTIEKVRRSFPNATRQGFLAEALPTITTMEP